MNKNDTAKSLVATETHKRRRVTRAGEAIRARLIAHEFIRNGMQLNHAYETVTKMKSAGKSIVSMTRGHVDEFLEEISLVMDQSRIDKGELLNKLWTLIESSIFDFFDDNGTMLTIAELKQLPRAYQQLVEQVKVKTIQVPVLGDDGKITFDDNGSPYLKTIQEVELKLPTKLAAMELLAKIMKLIGPAVVVNNTNNVNIANIMSEKAQQRRKLEGFYEVKQDLPSDADTSGDNET